MNLARFAFSTLILLSAAMHGCDEAGHASEQSARSGAGGHGEAVHEGAGGHGAHAIWVTNPKREDISIAQEYVCQIRSCRHIDVRPLGSGYLEPVAIREGQQVRQGDPMFSILPVMYRARLDSERAEADIARIERDNTRMLVDAKVISERELALAEAKLAKAEARANLAEVELGFTVVRAPFDGIVDRILEQQGSFVEEGDVLTTLSDNSVMWVYFNVPEARYLEYSEESRDAGALDGIELVLANGRAFPERGSIGAIEAEFNNETGNIAFRADFPNPEGLLRHGQTGKVRIPRKVEGALLIPQRATIQVLAKRFVFVVDGAGGVHQREIRVAHELEDLFVVESGLGENDRIVLEGVGQVRDGQRLDHYESRSAEEALANQKHHAE